jgi:DNA repair protein RadC
MPARKHTRPARQIAEVPRDERPRERLLKNGAQSLSDAELLAVVLKNGSAGNQLSTSPASF